MTKIIGSLSEIGQTYRALYCDLWGCLHDGQRAFPDAVSALIRFREVGGKVVLLTNSPRLRAHVARQLEGVGAPRDCYDVIVTSGDAAQTAMASHFFGKRIHHIGPERDLGFFIGDDGKPIDVERVPLEDAEGIVCTGLVDDETETPEDYRATLLYAKTKGLKFLCANPDIVVDMGEKRLYCAGALAQAYTEAGGQSYYFGKPHPPIYNLARNALAAINNGDADPSEVICVGDGIATDIQGAFGEGLDCIYITGGLAAVETGTTPKAGPAPEKLSAFLQSAKLSPQFAMAYLR
ncbi:MAG: TIGR01459 family HAD-type hydrolase [Pseudomonadota bacterium]